MLYRFLTAELPEAFENDCVSDGQGRHTYGQVAAAAEQMASQLVAHGVGPETKVAVHIPDGAALVAAIVALDRLGAEAYLIDGDLSAEDALRLMEQFEISTGVALGRDGGPWVSAAWPASPGYDGPDPGPAREGGRVVLLTSGTTGPPKGALHTWEVLAAVIRRSDKYRGKPWLITYGVTRFAGIQTFLHSFLNAGRLSIPASRDPRAVAEVIQRDQIEGVSATPTFWRKLLTATTPQQRAEMPLRQITMGGEIVSQGILNALSRAFPEALLTHVYGTTEFGVCFSVKDGNEGFPASFLEETPAGVDLKVQDGELWVRSQRTMQGYVGKQRLQEDWSPTGDLVEVRGDRVLFLGRDTEIINVGGAKVYPVEVEEEIRSVVGVAEVVVYGQRSSFVGQLVAADVVATPGADREDLKKRILEHCRERLPRQKQPHLLNFRDKLEETGSQKLARRR